MWWKLKSKLPFPFFPPCFFPSFLSLILSKVHFFFFCMYLFPFPFFFPLFLFLCLSFFLSPFFLSLLFFSLSFFLPPFPPLFTLPEFLLTPFPLPKFSPNFPRMVNSPTWLPLVTLLRQFQIKWISLMWNYDTLSQIFFLKDYHFH